jgi:hypothetical protein
MILIKIWSLVLVLVSVLVLALAKLKDSERRKRNSEHNLHVELYKIQLKIWIKSLKSEK